MWIELPKRLILQTYCYSRQAERSIDAALWTEWRELQEYYQDKTEELKEVLRELRAFIPFDQPPVALARRDELAKRLPSFDSLVLLVRSLLWRWNKSWHLRAEEIGFIVSTWEAFLSHLQAPSKPTQQALVELRQDFWACEYIVQQRCPGLGEVQHTPHIEHFNFPWHLTPVNINSIVSRCTPGIESRERTYEHP